MTENLPVKLTDTELRAKGEEIAAAAVELNTLEQQKSAASKQYGEKISTARATMSKIAQQITSKTEVRDVAIEYQNDYDEWLVRTVRLDTGEVIRQRTMNVEERQAKMKLIPLRRREAGEGVTVSDSPIPSTE